MGVESTVCWSFDIMGSDTGASGTTPGDIKRRALSIRSESRGFSIGVVAMYSVVNGTSCFFDDAKRIMHPIRVHVVKT
jgi:hypothetical protein